MAMSHGLAVHSGARVVTADGKQIGLVKDVRLDRFLVDVRWAPDYWLGTETVGDASEDLVQLLVAKEDLGSAKLHLDVTGPGLN
jgi:hypothetical protein